LGALPAVWAKTPPPNPAIAAAKAALAIIVFTGFMASSF
jgi:hypothetical protein